jgi:predicted protein tyrosine phosphatase
MPNIRISKPEGYDPHWLKRVNRNAYNLKKEYEAVTEKKTMPGGIEISAPEVDMSISRVRDHLYISGIGPVRKQGFLKDNGITHLVSILDKMHLKSSIPPGIQHLWIKAQDVDSERLGPHFSRIATFIADARECSGNPKVLVHCRQGMSRSAAAVLATLIINEGMRLEDGWRELKMVRPTVSPNRGFLTELRILERSYFGNLTSTKKLGLWDWYAPERKRVDYTAGEMKSKEEREREENRRFACLGVIC